MLWPVPGLRSLVHAAIAVGLIGVGVVVGRMSRDLDPVGVAGLALLAVSLGLLLARFSPPAGGGAAVGEAPAADREVVPVAPPPAADEEAAPERLGGIRGRWARAPVGKLALAMWVMTAAAVFVTFQGGKSRDRTLARAPRTHRIPREARATPAPAPPSHAPSPRRGRPPAERGPTRAAHPSARGLGSATLTRGSSGRAVKLLQRLLQVSPTGHFGALTEAAVKRFQRRAGLPATGVVAKLTRAALERKFP
jgi:peptidoglycan hydrolase-like protein with peptidoglycan-binding domain